MARLRQTSVAATAAALAVVAIAPPASATLGVPVLIAPAAPLPTTAPYGVNPTCIATLGAATGLNQITFVVTGLTETHSTNGTVAVATGMRCVVVDARTGAYYGSTPDLAVPGPAGATAGTVNVPLNSDPKLCGYATALFSDNHTATGTTLGC